MNKSIRNEMLASFIRESGDSAFAFAYGLSGNSEDAQELVAEALYRASRAWQHYDPSKPLGNWILRILRNLFLDGAKRYERRRAVSIDSQFNEDTGKCFEDTLTDRQGDVLDQLERAEIVGIVRSALNGLNADLRIALTLCCMDGLTCDAAARHLGIPKGTVRSRVHRARHALRKKLLGMLPDTSLTPIPSGNAPPVSMPLTATTS